MQHLLDIILQSKPAIAAVVTILLRLWTLPAVREGVFAKVKALPRPLQFVAPVALAMLAACGQSWLAGDRGEALLVATLTGGGEIGAEAIALWHVGKRLWVAAKKAPQVAPLLALLALASLSQACSVSLESSRAQGAADRRAGASPVAPSSRCETLDSQHRWGGTVAAGAALVAGGAGLSTIRVDDEDRELRYGLAIGAVGMAALAAGAEWYARDAASDWARECQK